MNISSATQAATQALQGTGDLEGVDSKRAQLQVAILKRALQSQQDEADTLLKMMSGKGQNVDLRV